MIPIEAKCVDLDRLAPSDQSELANLTKEMILRSDWMIYCPNGRDWVVRSENKQNFAQKRSEKGSGSQIECDYLIKPIQTPKRDPTSH